MNKRIQRARFASFGNMAQGVAWGARELGVKATVVVPDHAPATKLAAIERLGGQVVKVPFERWWAVLAEHSYPGLDGLFIHPVANRDVMAGNGTIGLEILEHLPDVDTVLVPFGGGGLSSGIAAALAALRPEARVFGCGSADHVPRILCSPTSIKTRSMSRADNQTPLLLNSAITGASSGIFPRRFASTRTPRVPLTPKPSRSAAKRAGRSSDNTKAAFRSTASQIAAASPGSS